VPAQLVGRGRRRECARSSVLGRRLERFLLVAWESGAVPLVALAKADACPGVAAAVAEAEVAALGAPVLALSVRTARAFDAVPLGRSGAGKSTLVNAAASEQRRRHRSLIRSIRAARKRGWKEARIGLLGGVDRGRRR
jgi:putative ribosome biogenesis GTPase RsgA